MASQVKFPKSEEELERLRYNPDGTPIESSRAKFWRKMTEQPLVPIGSLLTCGALIIASHHLRTGNRAQFQKALRWRVGLQGLTVAAAVGGTFYLGSGTPADSTTGTSEELSKITTVPGRPATVHQAQKAEERREAERIQLKERLREAEIQSERDEQRRAEEALLRPTGGSQQQSSRQRPVIGKDGRDRSVKA